MIERNEEETVVVFRKWPPGEGGDVLALFPGIPYDSTRPRLCMSYQHVGQHGAADFKGCVGETDPASPAEYADLKAELESIGYRLKVREEVR